MSTFDTTKAGVTEIQEEAKVSKVSEEMPHCVCVCACVRACVRV